MKEKRALVNLLLSSYFRSSDEFFSLEEPVSFKLPQQTSVGSGKLNLDHTVQIPCNQFRR